MKQFYIDWTFFVTTLAIAGLSLALIWSINPKFFFSQIIFFLVGFLLFFLVSQVNKDTLYSLAKPLYFISCILLIITLLNPEIRGASRWIDIFGFHMQPSELVKPFIVISYAYFMSRWQVSNLFALVKIIVIYFLPLLLIFWQPDLGNLIVYFLFLSGMLFANQLDLKIIISGLFLGFLSSPIVWSLLKDYQRERLLSFISPESDPQGASYNAIQAMITVGSGKFFGLGLGRGTQSHLRFLPENHTDFIFASLIEELGFFGGMVLLFLYGFIFWQILKSAASTNDKFCYLVTMGIFSQILSQVFINISMNMGMIPVTGVTLPLVSSGGSSIIATFVSLGIIASFKRLQRTEPIVIR